MANVAEIDSAYPDDVVAHEQAPGQAEADGPVPEHVASKKAEVVEQVKEASKGLTDGDEGKDGWGGSLDRVNAALVVSVAVVAVVGALVAVAKKLRER